MVKRTTPRHESLERLLQIAASAGLSGPAALAAALNESDQTITNWGGARGVSKAGAMKAQDRFGCSANWVLHGTPPKMINEDRQAQPVVEEARSPYEVGSEIPQFDTGGRMGHGLVLRDQPGMIQSWKVTPEWVAKNVHNFTSVRNLAIVTGFGDSMRPLYNPGDPLLVDRGVTTVDFDGIYFFRVGDEGFVKRLQRIPGNGLLAISENQSYRDWSVTKDMDFQVFARVVKIWRGEDF
ncbi:MAG: S24 family peptidase [Ramlibacter sp.]|nr:S24 family peptidase [Ramlibacter sp.]